MPDLPGFSCLPEWLDREAWEEFCKMRKQMKRVPFTDYAQKIALGHLTHWHEQGYDTTYILQESVLKGWRGLFVNERTPRRAMERTEQPVSPEKLAIFERVERHQREYWEKKNAQMAELKRLHGWRH